MATFNIAPFYDDFDAKKNFYKILFQPGRPVQTRELNQIQSIFQNQVENFGNHIFKNGAMVIPGQVYFDNNITYLKLQATYNSVSSDVLLDSMINKTVVNEAGTAKAYVIHAEKSDGLFPATIFVRYTYGATEFVADEVIYVETEPGVRVKMFSTSDYTGKGAIASVNEGIYYVNGTFCDVSKQTICVERYSTTPSYVVGLSVDESIVTVTDDSSLYDNALGYPNYGAPGADRYKISLTLTKKAYSDTIDSLTAINFIDLLHIKDGNITYAVDETAYAEIERMIAKRTYDESGNYLVNSFTFGSYNYRSNNRNAWNASTAYLIGDTVVTSENSYWVAMTDGISSTTEPSTAANTVFSFNDGGVLWRYTSNPAFNNGIFFEDDVTALNDMKTNSTKLAYKISPGSGYIQGHAVTKRAPTFEVTDKALDHDYKSNEIIPMYLGNFMTVTNVTGLPDINTYEQISLYYKLKNEVWSSLKRQATATVAIVGGAVDATSVNVTDFGFGYNRASPPTITVTSGAGTGAVFKCSVSQTGQIESITVVSPGSGYTNSASIGLTIAAPATNPVVIGTARVRSFEHSEGTIGTLTCKYRLEMFDINLADGYSFNDHVFSMSNGSGSFSCDLDQVTSTLVGTVSTIASSKEVDGIGTSFLADLVSGNLVKIGNSTYVRVGLDNYSDVVFQGTHTIASTLTGQTIKVVRNNFASTGALLKPMPRMFIRSLRSSDDYTINTSYTTIRRLTNSVTANATSFNLTVPGESFSNIAVAGNYVISRMDTNQVLDSSQYTLSRPTPQQLNITGLPLSSGNIEVIVRINKTGNAAREKQKTLKLVTKDILSVATLGKNTIQLDQSDIFRVVKIMKSNGAGTPVGGNYPAFVTTDAEDITSQFQFSNGQNLFYYDIGSITRNKGVTAPNNAIRVVYEYFEHSAGDYCSVNSYSNLPEEILTTLEKDFLDFRPVMTTGGFKITEAVEFGSDFAVDYSYYLPRQDLIELKSDGRAVVLNGRPGYDLNIPHADSDAMSIASVIVVPGKIDITSLTAQITPLGNVRYTMADISKLEQRIETLEYYTQLSLLEKESIDSSVIDQNGLDRFKAGIFVDNLKDQNNSDVSNADYLCAVDPIKAEARAFASVAHIGMSEYYQVDSQRASNNYRLTGDTITLPYTNAVFISQPVGNAQNYINPFAIIKFSGTMKIHPTSDTWVDTTILSDNIVHIDNYQAEWDKLNKAGKFGTVWGEWNVNYTATLTAAQWQGRFGADKIAGDTTQKSAVVNTGSFTVSSLTGPTTSSVTFNSGVNTSADNWLQIASNQLYARNGLTPGVGLRDGMRSSTQSNMGIVTNDIYDYTFNATRTGVQTYGVRSTTSTEVSNVVATSALGYTRTRPIFYKVDGCKPLSDMTYISFGDVRLPLDSSGDLETPLIIRVSSVPSTIGTFYNSKAISASSIASQYAKRLVSKTVLSKYTDISNQSEIVWDKGSLVENGTGGSAIVAEVVTGTSWYDLICVNAQGTWATGNNVLIDSVSNGTAVSVTQPTTVKKVTADANGRIFGVFYPVCNVTKRIAAGKNTLSFADSLDVKQATNSAQAEYVASGTSQQVQRTVTLTDTATLATKTVTDSTSFSQTVRYQEPVQNVDPVAQTFLIDRNFDSGVFVTQVGIYIAAVDAAMPLTVQIAETLNGYPTQKVLAEKLVYATQLTGKWSASTPTEYVITFDNPVFLKSGTEYCIIYKAPQSDKWKTWISVGAQSSGADDTVGSFFESQNSSTWSADQFKDMTFRLYRAKFDISSAADVTYVNSNLTNVQLGQNPLFAKSGSYFVRVSNPGHGFNVGDKVNITASLTVTPFGNLGTVNHDFTIVDLDTDTYMVDFSELTAVTAVATSTGYFGGSAGSVVVSNQIKYSTIVPNVDIASFGNTDYTISVLPVFYDTVTTNYEFDPEFIALNNSTVELGKPYAIMSYTNEVAKIAGDRSCKLRVTMTSVKDNLSPALSVDRTNLVLVKNNVNNPVFADLNAYDDITLATGVSLTYDYNQADPYNSTITVPAAAYNESFDQVILGQYLAVSGTTVNTGKAFLVNKITNGGTYIVFGVDATKTINTSTNDIVGVFMDEDVTGAKTNTVVLKSRFVHDISNANSSTISNYVARPMTMQLPSTGLRVTIDINMPAGTYVEVYYRAVMSNGFVALTDTVWKKMNSALISNTPATSFVETVWEETNVETFDQVQVKVAFKSDNDALTPKIKNVRQLALT